MSRIHSECLRSEQDIAFVLLRHFLVTINPIQASDPRDPALLIVDDRATRQISRYFSVHIFRVSHYPALPRKVQ